MNLILYVNEFDQELCRDFNLAFVPMKGDEVDLSGFKLSNINGLFDVIGRRIENNVLIVKLKAK